MGVLLRTTLVWSQHLMEADGEWAAGLIGWKGKPSRQGEGTRASASGGRTAFVPERRRAAERCGAMWPPNCTVLYCVVSYRPPAGWAGACAAAAGTWQGAAAQGCEPGGEEGP